MQLSKVKTELKQSNADMDNLFFDVHKAGVQCYTIKVMPNYVRDYLLDFNFTKRTDASEMASALNQAYKIDMDVMKKNISDAVDRV